MSVHNDLGILVGRPADYVAANASGYGEKEARLRFLWWVCILAPEVLRSLRDEVAPLPSEDRDAAVSAWTIRHNLDADWIRLAALETVALMADAEAYSRFQEWQRCIRDRIREAGTSLGEPELEWANVHFTLPTSWKSAAQFFEALGIPGWWMDRLPFSFNFRGWDPLEEPEATFRMEAQDTFRTALEAHIADQRGSAEATGARRIKRKRGPSRNQHFDWFVRFQVLGDTHEAIRKDVERKDQGGDVPESTIQRACSDVSKRIGLKSRSVRST